MGGESSDRAVKEGVMPNTEDQRRKSVVLLLRKAGHLAYPVSVSVVGKYISIWVGEKIPNPINVKIDPFKSQRIELFRNNKMEEISECNN